MKLIDADALVSYFANLCGDTIFVTDAAAVADNALPVCCAECAASTESPGTRSVP